MLLNRLLRKGAPVLSASISYKLASSNLDRTLQTTANEPQVARESQYYLANIVNVKTIDDFLANDRLYTYAMKAAGLSDMTYAKAFMRKVLTEGIDKSNSFANTLSDPRYKQFAQTFNFATFGATTTVFNKTQQGTVDNYVRQTLEEDTGQQSEGARLALYFQRKAPNITSIYDILADKALVQVVHTALQIPDLASLQDIDKQAAQLGNRINIADFKDPAKLQSFLSRFTSLWDAANSTSASPTNAAVQILGQASSFGISGDLLSAIQSLKLGGS
jgi:Protein of unknown function (DUF1217)